MPARQTVVVKKTTTKTRVRKPSGNKRGNPKRCPACGRFI